MKVYIESDEWYPVYFTSKNFGSYGVEMTDKEIKKYTKIFKDFDKAQIELRKKVEVMHKCGASK